MIRRLLAIVLTCVLACIVLIQPVAIAAGSSYYLPTLSADNPTTNWSQVTFSSFPPLDGTSTSVLQDSQLQNALGYNPSRSWTPGATLTNVLKVGDLYNFGLGSKAIGSFLGGTDPSKVALGSLSALNAVSLNGLMQAVPELKNLPVSSLPLAQSLFSGNWSALPSQAVKAASNYFPEINQFLSSNPALSNIPIGQIMQGNWQGALTQGAQLGLKQLTNVAPQLANIPLGSIVSNLSSGNFQGALNTGLNAGVSRLTQAFPELNGLPVAQVLGGITTGNFQGALNAGIQSGSQYLLGQVAQQFPELSNVPLGQVLNLNNFSMASVPGLAQTSISKIPGIANQSIGSIPGLGNVPVSQVLDLAQLLNMEFAKVDFLDQAAGKAGFALSGSTKDDRFKPESCVGKCPHFEVHDSKVLPGVSVNGRQWVTGDQQVPGGKGALASMNGGKEPTGLVPWGFGPNLKLVVTKVNDSQGKVDLALYMRVCYKDPFVDLGCTPFFIGPIPFGSVSEKGLVLIATSSPPPQVQVPPGMQGQVNNILGPDCAGGGTYKNVDVGALKSAISSRESQGTGGYAAVGDYLCDRDGNCGRALGKYQFMTYGPAKSIIASKTGGDGFLGVANTPNNSSDYKAYVSGALEKMFTPQEQESLMNSQMQNLINVGLSQGYQGPALVGRIAEMHEGGENAPSGIDSSYSQRVVNDYNQTAGKTASAGAGSCSTVAAAPCPPGKPCLFYNPLPASGLTTPFGWIPSRHRNHWGVDLATTYNNTGPGSPIHAAADGSVYATPDYFEGNGNYGHRTEIYHPASGLYTSYSHQYSRSVSIGQPIKRGQVIGVEGSTSGGMFTHLHYEISHNGGVPATGSSPFDPRTIPHSPTLGQ